MNTKGFALRWRQGRGSCDEEWVFRAAAVIIAPLFAAASSASVIRHEAGEKGEESDSRRRQMEME